jgi:hypothetical protein
MIPGRRDLTPHEHVVRDREGGAHRERLVDGLDPGIPRGDGRGELNLLSFKEDVSFVGLYRTRTPP